MSRFVEDITTTKPAADVERDVTGYLTDEGFKRVTYGGEEVWKKGMGLISGPQYIAATPVDGHVHLEAWLKFAILPGWYVGEVGTKGVMGALPKRKLRERVEHIEEILR